jgi:PTS hybrid protein
MIGIVVVSHSRALADAAVGLASEMVQGAGPTVAVAAGLDETTFGTDATAVAGAIEDADSPDGVLVLMDLGSAVMSAELALELVDPELAGRVRLCSAPLVEGLVAAVVTANADAPIDAVAAEALRGLAAKQEHIDDVSSSHAETSAGDATPAVEAEASAEVEIVNDQGIHARPAAKLVTMVSQFDADVTISNRTRQTGPVDADSVIMLVTLNGQKGDLLHVAATGPAAAAAVDGVVGFVADGMGD